MKKIFNILIILAFLSLIFIPVHVSSNIRIQPEFDTVFCFLSKNDTIILEPLGISPGMALLSNIIDVGGEIYIDDNWNEIIAEFCNSKYIKDQNCTLCD